MRCRVLNECFHYDYYIILIINNCIMPKKFGVNEKKEEAYAKK